MIKCFFCNKIVGGWEYYTITKYAPVPGPRSSIVYMHIVCPECYKKGEV